VDQIPQADIIEPAAAQPGVWWNAAFMRQPMRHF
jgi:hypothetical protein